MVQPEGRGLQKVVALDPGAHPVGPGIALEIGQGDVGVIGAARRIEARPAACGLASGGQLMKGVIRGYPGPDGMGAVTVAEGPDAGQGQGQRPAPARTGQLTVQIVSLLPGDLAVEAEGDVERLDRAPGGTGQARLTPGQGFGDVGRQGQGGKQALHATLGSGADAALQARFPLRGRLALTIFSLKAATSRRRIAGETRE